MGCSAHSLFAQTEVALATHSSVARIQVAHPATSWSRNQLPGLLLVAHRLVAQLAVCWPVPQPTIHLKPAGPTTYVAPSATPKTPFVNRLIHTHLFDCYCRPCFRKHIMNNTAASIKRNRHTISGSGRNLHAKKHVYIDICVC